MVVHIMPETVILPDGRTYQVSQRHTIRRVNPSGNLALVARDGPLARQIMRILESKDDHKTVV
jgi:hypothetical protein